MFECPRCIRSSIPSLDGVGRLLNPVVRSASTRPKDLHHFRDRRRPLRVLAMRPEFMKTGIHVDAAMTHLRPQRPDNAQPIASHDAVDDVLLLATKTLRARAVAVQDEFTIFYGCALVIFWLLRGFFSYLERSIIAGGKRRFNLVNTGNEKGVVLIVTRAQTFYGRPPTTMPCIRRRGQHWTPRRVFSSHRCSGSQRALLTNHNNHWWGCRRQHLKVDEVQVRIRGGRKRVENIRR